MTARPGFTLLELLVVILLLSALALSLSNFLVSTDDQLRYDDTKSRLEAIRQATLGTERVLAGRPVVSGFVADIGRLPDSVDELLEAHGLPAFAYDPATGLEAGWRGPYLPGLPELTTGERAWNDGWGRAFTFERRAGTAGDTLVVYSPGSPSGDSTYARPVPRPDHALVLPEDHALRASTVRVALVNRTAAPLSFSGGHELAWATAVDGAVAWPAAARSQALSLSLTIPAGDEASVAFSFSPPLVLPQGLRAFAIFPAGSATPLSPLHVLPVVPRTSLQDQRCVWR